MTTRIVLDAAHWRARLIVFRRRREDALAGIVPMDADEIEGGTAELALIESKLRELAPRKSYTANIVRLREWKERKGL